MFRVFFLSFALFCSAGIVRAQTGAATISTEKSAASGAAAATGTRITNFSGGVVDQQVTLNWESVNESGIQEYTIEHAGGSGVFEAIGSVRAKGSGNYSYRYHAGPGTGQARLRILKSNGETKFSPPLKLSINAQAGTLEASPNPATGIVQIQGLSYGDQCVLVGANGQTVRSFTAAHTTAQLNLEGLPAGIYLLQTRSAEGDPRPGLRIVKR